jgi:hypothetical protein
METCLCDTCIYNRNCQIIKSGRIMLTEKAVEKWVALAEEIEKGE